MAIQYAGGSIINTTFAADTKANIMDNLRTHLLSAGWSSISNAANDKVLRSAATPTANNSIDLRLRDTLLTNCCALNIRNQAGSIESQNHFLLPGASKVYRVIANKYQFFCFTAGASAAREFVAGGVLYTPSFLHGVITNDFGWMMGNGSSDASATVASSFRTQLGVAASSNCASGIVNSNLMTAASTSMVGSPCLVTLACATPDTSGAINHYRWHDDTELFCDPLLSWGLTAPTVEGKIRGQLWDAVVISNAYAADLNTFNFDSHTWWNITNSNAGGTSLHRGSLLVAIT